MLHQYMHSCIHLAQPAQPAQQAQQAQPAQPAQPSQPGSSQALQKKNNQTKPNCLANTCRKTYGFLKKCNHVLLCSTNVCIFANI